MSKQIDVSRELLSYLYERKKLTTFQIAEKIGCCQATIWKKLIEYCIRPRLPGAKRVNISKEKLRELYLNKKFSTWKIEKITKIPRGTIHRKLQEFNINLRDRATSHIIHPKKDFSGDLIEKSYLIGFRIGDLGVRKIYPNSKVIQVASGSTIKEQIDLIENLFKSYGKVWIKKTKNNKINICVSLNESFNFLLDKEIPKWILKNKKYFLSFLAGFIDAEGHIGIYNNMARFTLGNYDSSILFLIFDELNKYGIKCNSPFSDKRKGKKNNQGYTYNQNYWHFRIHNKYELESFFNLIKPYIKHANKLKALNMAILNINMRNSRRKHEN
ncbi:MAG: hypothetical protein KKF67_01260 [Nanoarchaeota archaeon]|nr:hypothetical protein [Nanoarchaeota archaeon]